MWSLRIDFSFVWMVIIMVSQVINAVKEYLPYSKRLHSLSTLSNNFNSLVLVMENDWYKVSRGLLTEGEINDLHMDIKRKKHEAAERARCADSKGYRSNANVKLLAALRS